ncbi:MAG: class I adenylate-forming enzyme family protein, partial [Actinomycetes bacterium]
HPRRARLHANVPVRQSGRVNELVAIDLPGGDAFVDAVRRCWDRGDAVLPIPQRGPDDWRRGVVDAMRPTRVVDASGEETALPGGQPVEPGDAVIIATSGTSGTPKGAVHTHESVTHAAYATAAAVGVAPDAAWLACLPLDHVGGFSVITRALITGAGLTVHDGFAAERVDQAGRSGATHVSLVPAVLDRIDTTAWRTILLGGSAIPAERPANTIATYGMTETFGGVVYDGLAIGGTSMRIGDDRAPDESGPIELATRSLLRCYRDGSDPVASNGWYRTGDIGWIEPGTGRLHVDGRADDLIITGGEKVWPHNVEQVIADHHGVVEVAVVGRPDPTWGQIVTAVVVPTTAPPTLDALRGLVESRLPPACAPRAMEFVDSLPRTSLGKIRRSELLDERGETGKPTQ